MGLDKDVGQWLNKHVIGKTFLQALGLGWMGQKNKESCVSPMVRERQRFEAEVREQFKKLKEKGISIPVFTL